MDLLLGSCVAWVLMLGFKGIDKNSKLVSWYPWISSFLCIATAYIMFFAGKFPIGAVLYNGLIMAFIQRTVGNDGIERLGKKALGL